MIVNITQGIEIKIKCAKLITGNNERGNEMNKFSLEFLDQIEDLSQENIDELLDGLWEENKEENKGDEE